MRRLRPLAASSFALRPPTVLDAVRRTLAVLPLLVFALLLDDCWLLPFVILASLWDGRRLTVRPAAVLGLFRFLSSTLVVLVVVRRLEERAGLFFGLLMWLDAEVAPNAGVLSNLRTVVEVVDDAITLLPRPPTADVLMPVNV